jgi:hypothetical protein
MDEHAEACLTPPCHARVALGCCFSILDCGDGVICADGDVLTLNLGEQRKRKCEQRHNGGDYAAIDLQGTSPMGELMA